MRKERRRGSFAISGGLRRVKHTQLSLTGSTCRPGRPPESGDVQRRERQAGHWAGGGGVNDASTVNERWDEADNRLVRRNSKLEWGRGKEAGTGGWVTRTHIRKGCSTQTPRRLYEAMAIDSRRGRGGEGRYGFVTASPCRSIVCHTISFNPMQGPTSSP